MSGTTVESLPQECLSHVISFTSPCDACRSAVVSTTFREAADSDFAWEKFLPSDYGDLLSRSVSPVEFSSNKDLFCRLASAPLLIDGVFFNRQMHKQEKLHVECKDLSIAWSTSSLYWSWKPLHRSRFCEVVELVMVCWLEIQGKIKSGMLSPNTTYGAYLIIQLVERAFGLDMVPSEAAVEVGNYRTQRTFTVKCDKGVKGRADGVICTRGDGWLEIELGELYNSGKDGDEEVRMSFRETKGVHLKGGIVVEGIEVRPKQ